MQIRALPQPLVDSLTHGGDLYADARANAVFLLRDAAGQSVGALVHRPNWAALTVALLRFTLWNRALARFTL
jgi:hypothetical protein